MRLPKTALIYPGLQVIRFTPGLQVIRCMPGLQVIRCTPGLQVIRCMPGLQVIRCTPGFQVIRCRPISKIFPWLSFNTALWTGIQTREVMKCPPDCTPQEDKISNLWIKPNTNANPNVTNKYFRLRLNATLRDVYSSYLCGIHLSVHSMFRSLAVLVTPVKMKLLELVFLCQWSSWQLW